MKKTLSILICMAILAMALTGCGSGQTSQPNEGDTSGTPEAKTYSLKVGSIWEDANPASATVEEFVKLIDESSGGTITAQYFPNSALGTLNEMLTGMSAGTIEMVHTRISMYGVLEGASMFNVCSAPFLWDNDEELQAFLKSEAAQQWFDEAAAATGVRVFYAEGVAPARELTANQPIENADDFEGLKIRTAESAVVQRTMQALGAQPIVIPLNDLYMSLRQGTVDAQEGDFISTQNTSLYEVQDYVMRTDYIRDVPIFCIAESIWQDMTPEQQQMMIDCAAQATVVGDELTAEQVEESFEFLKTEMEYVEIDVPSIQEKLSTLYEELDGETWAEGAYAVVKEFKDSYQGS